MAWQRQTETDRDVRAEVPGARGGEGGAGELLGVESQRAHQRAVLPHGERPRHRLRREAVAQPREVAQLRRRRSRSRSRRWLLLLHGHCRWRRRPGSGQQHVSKQSRAEQPTLLGDGTAVHVYPLADRPIREAATQIHFLFLS